jgi:hypothetical protein
MTRQGCAASCVLALLVLLNAAPADASSLPLGGSVVPTALGPVPSIPPSSFLFDTGRTLVTFGPPGSQVTVAFGETIIRDPFPPLFACGANCLDFVLQTQLVGGPAGATTLLTSISMNTFGTSAVDVGWLLDHASYQAPLTADRGPLGDVVTFDFAGIPIGAGNDTSQVLLIRTDRTSFSPQNFVGFTATVSVPGVPPTTESVLYSVQAVPEPSTLMLVAGAGLLGALARRRRATRV